MSEVHHAPHAKRFAVGEVDECAIGSYVRFEDYEALRKQYDHTYAVTLAKLQAAEARAVRCEGALRERDALLRNMARVAALIINEQQVHTITTAIVSAGYLAGLAKYANDAANLLLDSRPERPIVEVDYGSDL